MSNGEDTLHRKPKNEKVPYRKPKEGRILGGGGPRDLQRKQQMSETNDFWELKKLLEDKLKESEDKFSADEVKKKVEEAVRVTKKEEKVKYENGIKSLNDQLEAAKKKISIMENELNKANDTIRELKRNKTRSENESSEMKNLLEMMFDKISSLQSHQVSTNNISNEVDNEYKVFIDPSEENGGLESHINVESSDSPSKKDLKKDLDKLRTLVNKNKSKNKED